MNKLINPDTLINQMEKDFTGNFLYEKGFCQIDDMSFMECFEETLKKLPSLDVYEFALHIKQSIKKLDRYHDGIVSLYEVFDVIDKTIENL